MMLTRSSLGLQVEELTSEIRSENAKMLDLLNNLLNKPVSVSVTSILNDSVHKCRTPNFQSMRLPLTLEDREQPQVGGSLKQLEPSSPISIKNALFDPYRDIPSRKNIASNGSGSRTRIQHTHSPTDSKDTTVNRRLCLAANNQSRISNKSSSKSRCQSCEKIGGSRTQGGIVSRISPVRLQSKPSLRRCDSNQSVGSKGDFSKQYTQAKTTTSNRPKLETNTSKLKKLSATMLPKIPPKVLLKNRGKVTLMKL